MIYELLNVMVIELLIIFDFCINCWYIQIQSISRDYSDPWSQSSSIFTFQNTFSSSLINIYQRKSNQLTWEHSSANYLIKSQPKVHQFGQILHTNIQKHTIIEGKFCDRWIRKLENWQTIQIYYHLNSTDTHTHMRYL